LRVRAAKGAPLSNKAKVRSPAAPAARRQRLCRI